MNIDKMLLWRVDCLSSRMYEYDTNSINTLRSDRYMVSMFLCVIHTRNKQNQWILI